MSYKNLTKGTSWAIIKDHGFANDCKNATNEQISELFNDGFTQSFRLLDAENNIIYSGLARPYLSNDSIPLAMINPRCVKLQQLNIEQEKYL